MVQRVITLKEISNIVERKINEYEKMKSKLDDLHSKIFKLFNIERSLINSLHKINTKFQKLNLIFAGSDFMDKINEINKKIRNIEKDIEKVQLNIKNLSEKEFNTNLFESFYNNMINNIEKIRNNVLQDIEFQLDRIFKESQHIIKSYFLVSEKLINILNKIKKTKKSENFSKIIEKNIEDLKRKSAIIEKYVYNLNIDRILKMENSVLSNLFSKCKEMILIMNSNLRRFIISTKILSKDELRVIEEIYNSAEKELDFWDTIKNIHDKIMFDNRKIIECLFNLSKKGMITIKITI